jgi:hypothetical protein
MHPSGAKLTGCWCNGRRKKYAYYRYHSPRTDIRKQVVEDIFRAFLDSFELNAEECSKLQEQVHTHLIDAAATKVIASKQLEKQIADLKARQTMLVDKNIQGIISDALLKDQLNLVEIGLMKAYAAIQPIPQCNMAVEESYAIVEEFLKKPSLVWDKAPFGSKLKLQWFNFPKGV